MKFNKVYIPVDALARHEDFDTWYEDGDLFLHFACKKGWKSEKDRVQIFGRMGGQVGRDVSLWRDLSGGASNEQLDQDAATSLTWLRSVMEGKDTP